MYRIFGFATLVCALHAFGTAGVKEVDLEAVGVPLQYFYRPEDGKITEKDGCKLTSFDGMDADGVAGYPWMTYIDCPEGSTFTDSGINEGHVRFYLRHGSMSVNNQNLEVMGEAFWAVGLTPLTVAVSGYAFVVGAKFELTDGEPAIFTSSFGGPQVRLYKTSDALAGLNGADNGHDPHINNGTTNARDLVWNSITRVEPPSILVVNCAPDHSYVWYHSHPQGALYLVYSGQICFETDELRCSNAGEARWTSGNLFYREEFRKTDETDPDADEIVRLAFPPQNASMCHNPVVFGVTNFDPTIEEGQPNFVDVPENAGPQKWGYFETLAMRMTTVTTKYSYIKPEL